MNMKNQIPNLKPCPICGSPPNVYVEGTSRIVVECKPSKNNLHLRATITLHAFSPIQDAADGWNRRVDQYLEK